MKVLMQGKVDLFESGGGDKIQIENTARELQKLGVEVEIKPGFKVDYNNYDIVHLFQLDWTPETYLYARKAKKVGLPIVLSPIHHNVSELKRFDDVYTFDFRRIAKILFRNQFKRDTLKNIYKSFFDLRKAHSTLVSVVLGLENMQKSTLKASDVILVQTGLEAEDLIETYDIDIKWKIVPNGVGLQFVEFDNDKPTKNLFGISDYIVSVGRIEARKNQLSVIKAVDRFRKIHNVDVNLVFVGKKSNLKHFEYVYRFEKSIRNKSWIKYVEEVSYESMPSVYKYAKVCVSASWFETTGLTSLEALFCQANAVASGKRAKEYLGKYASYCDPADVDSIQKAIAKEYFANRPTITDFALKDYTWKNAAKKTLEVYESLLNK